MHLLSIYLPRSNLGELAAQKNWGKIYKKLKFYFFEYRDYMTRRTIRREILEVAFYSRPFKRS